MNVVNVVTEEVSDPVIGKWAIMIPGENIVFSKGIIHLEGVMDINSIVKHLSELGQVHGQIRGKVNRYNVSHDRGVQEQIQQIQVIIQETALQLLAGVEYLPQADECKGLNPERKRRSVQLVNEGLIPAIGSALSWIGGVLPSSAAKYINQNADNINVLLQAQGSLIRAVNQTNVQIKRNKNKIERIGEAFNKLSNKLSTSVDWLNKITIVDGWLGNLLTAAQEIRHTVDTMVQSWEAAVNKKVSPELLKGEMWSQLYSMLDSDTRQYKNLKYVIKMSSTVSIHACHTVVYTDIAAPLLPRSVVRSYRVIPVVIKQSGKYVKLANTPERVAWDDSKIYEQTESEIGKCKDIQLFLICNMPERSVDNFKSCFYRLANGLHIGDHCTVKMVDSVEDKINHIGRYLQYSIYGKSKVAITKCPQMRAVQKELKGNGVIEIPFKCRTIIGDRTYQNIVRSKDKKIYRIHPRFFTPSVGNLTEKGKYPELKLGELGDRTSELEVKKNLEEAKATLLTFDYHKHHFVYFHLGTMIAVGIIAIVIILTYIYFCGCPLCKDKKGTVRTHRDSC